MALSMLLRVRNVTRAVDMAPRHVDVWDDSARHRSAIVDAQREVAAAAPRSGGPGRRTAESAEERAGAQSGSRVLQDVLSSTSPAGFESLRVAEFSKLVAEPSQLSITRDKTRETLLYQPAKSTSVRAKQPQILLARLDLRSVDLHPVAEQLAVVSDSATWEFRLSEEADVDVPMADVPPGVFDEPMSAPSAVASGEPTAGAASLDEAIDVLTVLDGAGALTQQDVQLQRSSDGSLQVSGVVQDDVRRQALLQLLQSDAGHGLTVRIATVAEQSRQPRKSASLLVVEGGSENSGADAALTAYLRDTLHLAGAEAEHKRVEIENQLLAWSSDAESQAEALHEVLSLVPQGKTEEASAQVRREWGALVQHHAAVLHQDLTEIGKTLRPLRANLDDPSCAIQPPTTLTDPTELLSATRRISTNVSNFVTPAGAGSQNSPLTTSFGCLLESTEQRAARLTTPPPEP